MIDILAPANREILEQFAWSNVLLAFDFDGTLAPIVVDPARAAMRRTTRALLTSATQHYPVIVISGRSRSDVRSRVRGTGVHAVFGNHGIEPWHASERIIRDVRRWLPLLRKRLQHMRGVEVEDKVYSLAVHYRRARAPRAARAAVIAAVSRLDGVRLVGGKMVINVLPAGAPHKGIALERERAKLGCDTALYVGDDETDEDVFGLDRPGQILGVRVGRKAISAAAYFISRQHAIDDLLRTMIDLRRAVSTARRAIR